MEQYAALGNHLICIDGDTIFLIVRGPLLVDDMQAFLDTCDRIMTEQEYLFVLYDGRECTGIDPAARRLVTKEKLTRREADLQVAFGVPFGIRIMVNMLIRAQALLLGRNVRLALFDTEKEARAFLESERSKIRAQSPAQRHFDASLQQRTPVE